VRAELTIEIARSATDVFDYLTDVEKLPEWQSSLVAARSEGEPGVGMHIVERRALLGREAETELEVTAYELRRRFALRSVRGPVELEIDHALEEHEGSTTLAVTARAKAGGLLRFAGRAVEGRARKELERDFGRLKAILERDR
jgi:carbon monoxide dehydrogenase subunit G